jgi:hypothetical protein
MSALRTSVSRMTYALIVLTGMDGCATFSGYPAKTRLSDDFSYYEPFDNSTETGGPDYLVGPPSPLGNAQLHQSSDNSQRVLPSIPDRSLPRSCLSCD